MLQSHTARPLFFYIGLGRNKRVCMATLFWQSPTWFYYMASDWPERLVDWCWVVGTAHRDGFDRWFWEATYSSCNDTATSSTLCVVSVCQCTVLLTTHRVYSMTSYSVVSFTWPSLSEFSRNLFCHELQLNQRVSIRSHVVKSLGIARTK